MVSFFCLGFVYLTYRKKLKIWIHFNPLDCVVKDTNLNTEYEIITNQCGDSFLGFENYEVKSDNVQSAINFSYHSFKFVESVDDEAAVNMKLECSVIVCDGNDQSSACARGCIEY